MNRLRMEITVKEVEEHILACENFLDKNETIPISYDQRKGKADISP